METIAIKGVITSTSNKVSEDYKSENPKKSVYLVLDEKSSKVAKEFGLTEYESKKDKTKFFVVKSSSNVKIIDVEGNIINEFSGDVSEKNPNFSSNEKEVKLAIMKSNKSGNDFTRLYAIGVNDILDVTVNEMTNPFEEMDV